VARAAGRAPSSTSSEGPAARSPLFFIGVAVAVLMLSGVLALWQSRSRAAARTVESAAPPGGDPGEAAGSADSSEGKPPPKFVVSPALLEKDGEVRVVRSRAYSRKKQEAMRNGAANTEAPTLRREEGREGPPRSPAVIARERQLRTRIENLTRGNPALQIGFTDCASGDCVARVQSPRAADIDRFAAEARRTGGFQVERVRERLTAYNGRLWEVEVAAMKGATDPAPEPAPSR
jgi:hypothetical protein